MDGIFRRHRVWNSSVHGAENGWDAMTYDPNSARKGGSRKHLIEEVIKHVDSYQRGAPVIYSMTQIVQAVRKYQKEMVK